MRDHIQISVRTLVEYVYNSGSIDVALQIKNNAMLDGVKTHQRVQGNYEAQDQKEVYLQYSLEYKEFTFTLDGRCDGLLFRGNEVIIDEIKSSARGVDHIDGMGKEVHWAQAKLYGYMYMKEQDIDRIFVQLTYADVKSDEIKSTKQQYSLGELEQYLYFVLDDYIKFASIRYGFEKVKIASMKELAFPFSTYRKGQRDLAVASYKTLLDGKKLFVKAPTGIGKTISTIFPTIKAIGEKKVNKLVYVTAKTITRTVAEETFALLRKRGLRMKVCTITAKDKICFQDETNCQKDVCPFANGYYDRINEAIIDIYKHEDVFNRETIERYARKHTICPFEFSLDLSSQADAIICDYNYVFDPRVYLKRLQMESRKKYALLVDEAHNLVDRARTMYSAMICKSRFLELKRLFAHSEKDISDSAGKINSNLLALKKDKLSLEKYCTMASQPVELVELLEEFVEVCEHWFPLNANKEGYEQLLEAYFEANTFLKISKLYDDKYVTYVERIKNEVNMKLLCLDPSRNLREYSKHYRGTIFFSATLIPGMYYKDMLGGDGEDYTLSLTSPFERDNLDLSIVNVSTRFKDREYTSKRIVDTVFNRVSAAGVGNFLVFLPSYQYMQAIYDKFIEHHPDIPTLMQSNSMNEEERETFLLQFQDRKDGILLGFAVLGGIFSEGIDLKGDRLNGVFVVGVGLPQINTELDIIKDYFQKSGKNGYDYAYVYPGISKVLQAGGRLIRTETDKGVLVLLDDRFLTPKYQQLLPYEWQSFNVVR